jgi:Domain of unknown function (DUF1707)/2TM domain
MEDAWRVGDEERERTVTLLHEHASRGRLEPDELDTRVEAALSARTRGELAELVGDLPAAPAKQRPRQDVVRFQRHLGVFTVMSLFFIAVWALSGGGYFWPAWAMLGWGIALGIQAVKLRFPGD